MASMYGLGSKKFALRESFDNFFSMQSEVQVENQTLKTKNQHLEDEVKRLHSIIMLLKKVVLATVRKVFDIGKRGVIAGCYISEGVVKRGNIVQCFRKNEKVGEGKIASLQRERKTVKEVHAGQECGFITDSFHDWKEDDTVQIFVEEKKKRSEV